jgi:hypothetical protein
MFEQDFSPCCRAQGVVVRKFQPDIHGLSRALAHVVHRLPGRIAPQQRGRSWASETSGECRKCVFALLDCASATTISHHRFFLHYR